MPPNNPFSLEGKTLLVTGASSGIGRSIAVECSRMGATVIITARNQSRLEETFSMMSGVGHQIIQADISQLQGIEVLVSALPSLDGVVQNAGVNEKTLVKFITENKIKHIIDTNFVAPVLMTQKLLKSNKIRKHGSVLFISSIASEYASATNALYASSKGAINSFLRVLALELAPQRIRVNGIQPGIVRTEILASYQMQEDLAEHEKEYPLGSFGQPEDIAYGAVYLLSDASKWVTGSLFRIDGGITLR